MSGPPGNCPPTDEGPEKIQGEDGSAKLNAESTAALRPLRSETLQLIEPAAVEASVTDPGTDHADLQLPFLSPSDRPGSMGRSGH